MLMLIVAAPAFSALKVTNLRVNGLVNPIGVDNEQPLFSWTVSDGDMKDVEQTTFRVQIYTNALCSKRVWNSKQQKSNLSEINAPMLEGVGTKYYWRVEIRDNKGRMVISKPAWFITGLNGTGWSNAQWIGAEPTVKSSEAPLFHKSFKVAKKKILNARGYVSALGTFDLNVNGKRVGTEGTDGQTVYDELKAGWTEFRKEVPYMTFDLTDYIRKGDNSIDIQMSSGWWNGSIARDIYGKTQKEVMMKVMVMYNDSTLDSIVTDRTWQYTTDGPLRSADIYNGEEYDATRTNQNLWRWHPVSICNDYHGNVIAMQGPAVRVKPQYERQPRTAVIYNKIKHTGTTYGAIDTLKTVTSLRQMHIDKGDTLIIDMGQNMVGWIDLNIIGDRGTHVTCRFAEMLNDNGDASRLNDGPAGSPYFQNLRSAKATVRYTLAGSAKGEQYHPSSTFMGFRYVKMYADADITLNSVNGTVVGSDINEYGEFQCSDSSINALYNNIRWSQRGNFLSVPTDCPQRDERMGWTGDAQIFSRTACYNADMRAFYEKWMTDLRNSQFEDGGYPDTAPFAHYASDHANAAWGDAGIIVPWIVYQMYGNTDILDQNYESMQLYMSYLQSLNDEQWYYNGSGTKYGDWLAYEDTEARYISVCYYAHVADLMSQISIALGKENEPDQYSTLASEIRKEFRRRFMPDGHLTITTQTACLMALHYNMLETDEQYNEVKQMLRDKIVSNGYRLSTGFVGTAILMQTLSEYDMADLAYDLLQQRSNPSWLYSVDLGATTMWERWDSYTKEGGFNQHGGSMNSFNHYAYGVVGEWMYRNMLGIDIDYTRPGFSHILLRPQPDTRTSFPEGQHRIDWASAATITPYGRVSMEWRRDKNDKLTYDIIVPFNATATFYHPQPDGSTKEVELTCGHWTFE